MEISTVNSVVGQEWQRLHPIEGEAVGTISFQTWRRDTSAVALGCSDQQGNQRQQRSAAGDQATSVINMKRSSRFRGVSRHRWTGRYEAHLWDKGAWNPKRRKKGKQVYLGAYVEEESAARAYDLAALKYWGTAAVTNFPVSEYTKETEMMHTVTNEVYLAHLRRRSSGFSRGASRSRGVARHHHSGRWEARIGRGPGNKYLYLGTYGTQEQAARGYDMESIEHRGINAVTNCDSSKHIRLQRPAADPPAPESSSTFESLPFCNQIPSRDINQTRLSILHSNIYPSRPEGLDSLKKHDIIWKSKAPITPGATKSPSSTALGLLLKSSFFKELVEKNSTASDEKINEKETKAPPQQAANNIDVGQIFYGGMSYSPYMFPSNRDTSAYLELKE